MNRITTCWQWLLSKLQLAHLGWGWEAAVKGLNGIEQCCCAVSSWAGISQKTLSSNLFAARVTLELSIVTAASDKIFPLDLLVFLWGGGVCLCLPVFTKTLPSLKILKAWFLPHRGCCCTGLMLDEKLLGIQNIWWQWTVWLMRTRSFSIVGQLCVCWQW